MNKKEKTILNKNNKREELINEENDKVLTDMICYLRVSGISKYNQELVRADLIEMILDAQERGENIQQVMGKDYKQICDNIIAEFSQETKAKKAVEYIRIALICVVIFGLYSIIFQVIDSIANNKAFIYNLQVSFLIEAITIIVASNFIVKYICKNPFDEDNRKSINSNKVKSFLVIFVTILVILILFMACSYLFNSTILIMPLYVTVISVVILFIIERVLNKIV